MSDNSNYLMNLLRSANQSSYDKSTPIPVQAGGNRYSTFTTPETPATLAIPPATPTYAAPNPEPARSQMGKVATAGVGSPVTLAQPVSEGEKMAQIAATMDANGEKSQLNPNITSGSGYYDPSKDPKVMALADKAGIPASTVALSNVPRNNLPATPTTPPTATTTPSTGATPAPASKVAVAPVAIPSVTADGPKPVLTTGAPGSGLQDDNQKKLMDMLNGWKPIGTQGTAEQPDYVDQFKNRKQSIWDVLANIGDHINVAVQRGTGDQNAITRAQQQYNTALASNQEANKQHAQNLAQNSQTAAQANAAQEQLRNTLPATTQGAINQRLAPIAPQAEADLYVSLGTLGGQLKNSLANIDEQTKQNVLQAFATLPPELKKIMAQQYVNLANSNIHTYAPGAGTAAPNK